ncbi:hypothetical protein CW745_07840, partial [Psychromonas sp. psych-6C06]
GAGGGPFPVPTWPGSEGRNQKPMKASKREASLKMSSHWNFKFPKGPLETTTLIGKVCKCSNVLS